MFPSQYSINDRKTTLSVVTMKNMFLLLKYCRNIKAMNTQDAFLVKSSVKFSDFYAANVLLIFNFVFVRNK